MADLAPPPLLAGQAPRRLRHAIEWDWERDSGGKQLAS
jgi:hypothetical protein